MCLGDLLGRGDSPVLTPTKSRADRSTVLHPAIASDASSSSSSSSSSSNINNNNNNNNNNGSLSAPTAAPTAIDDDDWSDDCVLDSIGSPVPPISNEKGVGKKKRKESIPKNKKKTIKGNKKIDEVSSVDEATKKKAAISKKRRRKNYDTDEEEKEEKKTETELEAIGRGKDNDGEESGNVPENEEVREVERVNNEIADRAVDLKRDDVEVSRSAIKMKRDLDEKAKQTANQNEKQLEIAMSNSEEYST